MIKWCIMKSVLVIIFVVTSSFSFAKWEPCNNSYFDSQIASIKENGEYLYAVTIGKGVLISTDKGATWFSRSNGLGTKSISELAFRNTSIFAGSSSGLFYSSNLGLSWSWLSKSMEYEHFYTIDMNGIYIFAGTGKGVFLSTDNGTSWEQKLVSPIGSFIRSVKVVGKNVYAITQNNFYHSSDNGNSWVIRNEGLNTKSLSAISIKNSEIFVATEEGLYYSNNHGKNWREISNNRDIYGLSTNDEAIIFIASNYIFISSDNGVNWEIKPLDKEIEFVSSSYSKNNIIILSTYDGKIFKSNDKGKTWIKARINLLKTKVSSFVKNEFNLVAGTGEGIFLSSNNGERWHQKNSGMINLDIKSLVIKDNVIISGIENGVFMADYRLNWFSAFSWLSSLSGKLTTLATDGVNIIFSRAKGELYKSTNNGINWDRCQKVFDKNVLSLCYDNDFLYAGTTDGFFISTNHGESFSDYSNGLKSKIINSIHVANGIIFAGTGGGGVFSSSDGGNTWISKQNGLKSQYIRGFCSYGNFIFAASIDGVFMSSDKGENWIEINDNLTNKNVYSVIVSGDYLFAGTSDDGIFRTKLSDYGISGLNDFSQKTLSISPNPASDFITIQFSNKELKPFVTNYKIQIFDMLGVEVISTFAPTNEEKLRIDVSHLPAGVYVIRIGDKVEKFVKM